MAIESLMQQGAPFVDALSFRPAAAEKTEAETALEIKTPEQGDTATISEEGRALVALSKSEESKESDREKDFEQTIALLKHRIEVLEKEVKALKDNDELPPERKLSQLQDKETLLMELRMQLLKTQQSKLKVDGMADGGGTRANGFGNSATTF